MEAVKEVGSTIDEEEDEVVVVQVVEDGHHETDEDEEDEEPIPLFEELNDHPFYKQLCLRVDSIVWQDSARSFEFTGQWRILTSLRGHWG